MRKELNELASRADESGAEDVAKKARAYANQLPNAVKDRRQRGGLEVLAEI